jgi:hypothetical protein
MERGTVFVQIRVAPDIGESSVFPYRWLCYSTWDSLRSKTVIKMPFFLFLELIPVESGISSTQRTEIILGK